MYMLYTLIGGGQLSNTFFESGGKCPPLLIIRGGGQMSSYTIFHSGGVQMSEGANVLHSHKR